MSGFMKDERWYAVQTRSCFEKHVLSDLSARGIENYCPAFTELHHWADRKKLVTRPVFPGYVFARFQDSPAARLVVLKAHGTVRILSLANTPEPVPDEQIHSIRRALDSGRSCFAHPFLREGCWVRVRRGALKDMEGLLVQVKGKSRIILSVSMLQRSIAVEVDVRDVEVVRSPAQNLEREATRCTQILSSSSGEQAFGKTGLPRC